MACKIRRKFKVMTKSKHDKPVAPILLDRHFTTEKPDLAYVGDLTYIPTREGWLYLGAVDVSWQEYWQDKSKPAE